MVASKIKPRSGVTCAQVADFLGEETVSVLVASKAMRCSKVTVLTMLARDVFTEVKGEFANSAKSVYPDEIDLWIEMKKLDHEERVRRLREYRIQQGRPVKPVRKGT